MSGLQKGNFDAAFPAVFERSTYSSGVFPQDLSAAAGLHRTIFSLYHLKKSKISWDGKNFSGIKKAIGITLGHELTERLNRLSVPLDTKSSSTTQNLDKLVRKRIEGVIAESHAVDASLSGDTKKYAAITKHPVPVDSKVHFLIFSFDYYRKNKDQAEKVWGKLKSYSGL